MARNWRESVNKATSRDGTPIAFGRSGQGQPVILVDGALCSRAFGPLPQLAPLLASRFTVFHYDRRGRNESGDKAPYAIEREVEDLEAVLKEAGGSAFVFGLSSGAALALEAANRLTGIKKLALYEAPFLVDDTYPPLPADYLAQLKALVAADRRSDAVKLFMKRVGAPSFFVAVMQLLPVWAKLKAVAPTLVYDITIVEGNQVGKPLQAYRWSSVTVPTLMCAGGKSPAWMRNGMKALTETVPSAKLRVLDGQTHMIKPKVLAPVLLEFFQS
jgi:pimeloyl-ACP methyl ester carboxylesterase